MLTSPKGHIYAPSRPPARPHHSWGESRWPALANQRCLRTPGTGSREQKHYPAWMAQGPVPGCAGVGTRSGVWLCVLLSFLLRLPLRGDGTASPPLRFQLLGVCSALHCDCSFSEHFLIQCPFDKPLFSLNQPNALLATANSLAEACDEGPTLPRRRLRKSSHSLS